jgi:type IV pilus assembly protein PilN
MRIRVNLLPHRAERRERQKKAFFFLTAISLLAGITLVAVVWSVLQGQIGSQRERNQFIAEENRKLDLQIREIATLRQEIDALRARQRAVEDLQADRNQPVYLLDELARQVPEGIYLRTVKQDDKKVSVTGWAASNERVSELLRNLQANSKFLERPELVEIRVSGQAPAGQQRRLFEFSLNFALKPTPERAQLQQAQSSAKQTPAKQAPAKPAPAKK